MRTSYSRDLPVNPKDAWDYGHPGVISPTLFNTWALNMNDTQPSVHCVECDNHAVWMRNTQFAGTHPYCDKHARAQSDFDENSSYTDWSLLK